MRLKNFIAHMPKINLRTKCMPTNFLKVNINMPEGHVNSANHRQVAEPIQKEQHASFESHGSSSELSSDVSSLPDMKTRSKSPGSTCR